MARLSMSVWAVAFFLAVFARALPVQQDAGQGQMMDPWMEFESQALSSASHMMDEINDDVDQKTKELQEQHDNDHGKDEVDDTRSSDNKWQRLPEIPPTPEEIAKAHHKHDDEEEDDEHKPSKDDDKKADEPVEVHVEKPHHDEEAEETPAPKPEDKPEEKPKEEKPKEEEPKEEEPKEEKPAEEPEEEPKEEPHSASPSPTTTSTPTVTPSPTASAVPTPTPTKKGLLGSLPIAGNLLGKLGL
ncbi:hypothetical protein BJX96DRAFT_127336 [Aspergillus floccosus]